MDKGSVCHPKKVVCQEAAFVAIQHTLDATYPHAYYVPPALVQVPTQVDMACAETFTPILYMIPYTTLDEAIAIHSGITRARASGPARPPSALIVRPWRVRSHNGVPTRRHAPHRR